MSQANLETVSDHLHAMRRRDLESMATRLDPDVVHQGVQDHLVCNDRDEVLDSMRGSLTREDFGVDHLEIIEAGDRVVVGISGSLFRDVPWAPLQGQVFVVYTLRDGRIVRMDDHLTRAEALAAAGVAVVDWA
jgi:ketosteroid isomerase-like protein